MATKKNTGKSDPDSKRTGGSCGETFGCLIILVAVAGVLFWFIIKPKLEESGYSFDDLLGRAEELKDNIVDSVNSAKDKFDDAKDKLGEASDKVKDIHETVSDKVDDVKDSVDNLKDQAKDLKDKADKGLEQAEPELIEG
jgi:gas vesicle protein